mmetsp:Transcript_16017/g.24223  ORF Transcript_16017/g.24223 Transcript_16017/m.24223 type:complete len:554 (-) Transcript_16017:31-1692(-)
MRKRQTDLSAMECWHGHLHFLRSIIIILALVSTTTHSLSLNKSVQSRVYSRSLGSTVSVSKSLASQHNCRNRVDNDVLTNRQSSTMLYEATAHDSCTNDTKQPASRFRLLLSNIIKGKDLSVPAVLLASFLNLLGFTMASPIQPALGKHFELPLGASFGSLSSAYPLGMMLGVFLWPTLSDVIGRKIVMATTLAGSGMGLLLQSYGVQRQWTLQQFLAARVLTGCFAGNSPISKAYLADRGAEGNRAELSKYLAWKDAASTMAFIVGPVLGGLLYQGGKSVVDNTKSISFVILCSAVASLLASFSIITCVKDQTAKVVPDPKGVKVATNSTTASAMESKEKADSSIISCPLGTRLWTGVATVAGVSALYHAADSTFFAFFPSLLQNRLSFDTQGVGLTFTMFAFISFGMSAFVSSRFVGRYGPVAACSTGLGVIGTALLALGYAATQSWIPALPVILGAASLYYVGVPLYGPSVPTMLLQCVPSNKRGVVMGFDGTINTMARVVSPLAMGEIHRRYGPGPCFGAAGLFAYSAAILALVRRWVVLRKDFSKASS